MSGDWRLCNIPIRWRAHDVFASLNREKRGKKTLQKQIRDVLCILTTHWIRRRRKNILKTSTADLVCCQIPCVLWRNWQTKSQNCENALKRIRFKTNTHRKINNKKKESQTEFWQQQRREEMVPWWVQGNTGRGRGGEAGPAAAPLAQTQEVGFCTNRRQLLLELKRTMQPRQTVAPLAPPGQPLRMPIAAPSTHPPPPEQWVRTAQVLFLCQSKLLPSYL